MKQWIVIAGLLMMPVAVPVAVAAADMGGMKMQEGAKMFLKKAEVDGYTVSFHVMQNAGRSNGGTHDMMVKIEKDGQPVVVVMANSKVITADGRAETKKMMAMGDWFVAGYDLGAEGQQQLMVLFKTEDDKKHFVGVWYPGRDERR